jgi:hypothetical protein
MFLWLENSFLPWSSWASGKFVTSGKGDDSPMASVPNDSEGRGSSILCTTLLALEFALTLDPTLEALWLLVCCERMFAGKWIPENED